MGEGRFSPTLGDAKQFHFQMPEGQRGRGCKINQQPLRAPLTTRKGAPLFYASKMFFLTKNLS